MTLEKSIKLLKKKIEFANSSDFEHVRMNIEMAEEVKSFLEDYYRFLRTEEDYEAGDEELEEGLEECFCHCQEKE